MAKLVNEAKASSDFFSPVQVNCLEILVKSSDLLEIYSISDSPELIKKIQYQESNTIYDYMWVPYTSTYLTLIKDHPLSLHTSRTGKLIHKFPVYNHLYEIKSPYAACVSASSIYTSLGNKLFEFDIESPLVSTSIIKGQLKPRSVTNAISQNSSLLALGSYNKEVYLIDKKTYKISAVLQGQEGGVIQTLFQNNYFYVGGRKDSKVLLWDLRLLKAPVFSNSFPRRTPSHQKVLFDVDSNGRVAVGEPDGRVIIFNKFGEVELEFFAHFDAVNSVQFGNGKLVTSSGQRHYGKDGENGAASLIRVWENY